MEKAKKGNEEKNNEKKGVFVDETEAKQLLLGLSNINSRLEEAVKAMEELDGDILLLLNTQRSLNQGVGKVRNGFCK